MTRKLLYPALLIAAAAGLWLAWDLARSGDPAYRVRELVLYPRFRRYDPLIAEMSAHHGVDPLLVKALVWRESTFDPSKEGSNGERGLMQITEGAAADWAKSEKINSFAPADLFSPRTNLQVGTWYLAQAMNHWKDRDDPVPFALAEFNAGRSRVHRWNEGTAKEEGVTGAGLRSNIDYPTTRRYVESILDRVEYYRQHGEAKVLKVPQR